MATPKASVDAVTTLVSVLCAAAALAASASSQPDQGALAAGVKRPRFIDAGATLKSTLTRPQPWFPARRSNARPIDAEKYLERRRAIEMVPRGT